MIASSVKVFKHGVIFAGLLYGNSLCPSCFSGSGIFSNVTVFYGSGISAMPAFFLPLLL
jgi:hypothetical protein